MASVEEDSISIVITADASKATDAFDDALDKLTELEKKVDGMSGKLGGFGSGLAQGIAPALTALSDLADKADSLDGFEKRLTGVANGIGNLSKVTGTESAAAGRTVSQLASSIGSLESLDGNRLDALANGLDKIPDAVRELSGTKLETIDDLKEKLDHLADASAQASKVGNGIAGLGQGLKNIPSGIDKMNDIEDYGSQMVMLQGRLTALSRAVTVFSDESKSSVKSIRSLAEALKLFSKADPEALASGLQTATTALEGFVTNLNGWAAENDISEFTELADAVDKVASSYSKLDAAKAAVKGGGGGGMQAGSGGFADALSGIAGKASDVLSGIGDVAGKALTAGWNAATRAAQAYLSVYQRIASVPIDSMRDSIDSITHAVSRLLSMAASAVFYNSLFSMLRAATDGVTAGIQNLYQWALIMGNGFVGTMDSCATSLLYFQNSIGGAASELLDALAPAFETIVNYAVAALNAINQLLAALTGHSTWRRARRAQTQFATAATGAADASQDAADSASNNASATDDATKAEKRYENTVLGFDELNKLNSEDEDKGSKGRSPRGSKGRTPKGGGAAVPDYGSMFEDVPIDQKFKDLANTDDWTKLGKGIADSLNNWEKGIDWDSIDKTAAKWSKRVWTAFNGFVQERDWSSFGYTIARGLNVGLHFIDDIAQHADFTGFGAGIAGALNKAVETLDWASLGRVMTDKLKVQLEILHGFMQGKNGNDTYAKFNFDELRNKINVAIDSAFANIDWQTALTDLTDFFGQVGLTIVSGFNRIAQNIDYEVQNTDWTSWGSQVAGYLNQAVQSIDWNNLGRLFSDGLKIVFEALHGINQTFDWDGFRSGISSAIDSAFRNIDWRTAANDLAQVMGEIGKTLLTFGGVVLKNLVSALKQVDWAGLGKQLGDWLNQMLGDVDWEQVGNDIMTLFVDVLEFFGNAIATFDWLGLAADIFNMLKGMLESVDWGSAAMTALYYIGYALGTIVSSALSALIDLIRNTNWADVGTAILDGVGGIIQGLIDGVWSLIKGFFQAIYDKLPDPIKKIIDSVKKFFDPTPAYGEELGDETGQNYSDAIGDHKSDTESSGKKLGDAVKGALDPFVTGARGWGDTLGSNLKNGVNGAKSSIQSAGSNVGSAAKNGITGVINSASSWGSSAMDKLRNGVNSGRSTVSGAANSVGNAAKSGITGIMSNASSWGSSAMDRMRSGISGARSSVSNAAGSIANSVKSSLNSMGGSARYWGSDLGAKFANGIRSAYRWVYDAASNIAGCVRRLLHFSEPDEGPLADFHTYAPDMMRELASGIDQYRYLVTDSVRGVADGMAGQLSLDGKDMSLDATASIANAVTLGVVGSQPQQQSQQQDRPITLVLRIGDEDIARATYRGIDSLASRGVITPDFV